jgi:hypothetical protein
MEACDQQIQALLKSLTQDQEPRYQEPRLPQSSSQIRHHAAPIEDLHGKLVTLCEGCDAGLWSGFSPLTFLKLVSEVGTDLSCWKSEKHFTSWLGLAPGRPESGKICRRFIRPRKTKAGQIFREAA